jgi:hypothetical protein
MPPRPRRSSPAWLAALLLAGVLACAGVAAGGGPGEGPPGPAPKLTFDPAALDDEGLTGPPDGRVAVAYEFCIPATGAHAAEVRGLDPTAEVQRGSPGRVGCGPGQWLVVGSTHQPGWRAVLAGLVALPYVARIDRADFE